MPVSEVRYPLAQITKESRDGWRAFTARHGGNPTVLAEVLGLYLGSIDQPPPWLKRLVQEAVELETARRDRTT